MFYLLGQILVCLVLAGMLGVSVGWLLRGTGAESRENRLESRWRMKVRQRETEVAEMRTAAQRTRAAMIASERRHQALMNVKEQEIGDQKPVNDEIVDITETDALRAQVAELTARLEQSLPQDSVREAWGDLRRIIESKDTQIARLMMQMEASGVEPFPKPAAAPGTAPVSAPAVASAGLSAVVPAGASDDAPVVMPTGDEKDDLKTIYGIGPATERKLNKLGFTRFRQIALLSDADILRIAEELDCQPDRIERDHWVRNAHLAYEAKYGKAVESG